MAEKCAGAHAWLLSLPSPLPLPLSALVLVFVDTVAAAVVVVMTSTMRGTVPLSAKEDARRRLDEERFDLDLVVDEARRRREGGTADFEGLLPVDGRCSTNSMVVGITSMVLLLRRPLSVHVGPLLVFCC